jgi:asparagine N-glycosylation enzyme membrane subunit Stt3
MEIISNNETSEEKLIEERKEKVKNFLKNKQIWVIGVLLIAVVLGMYIRMLPMTDHNGHPGLWDITTNSWTLGPDLDPWLFERYAKMIVQQGDLPKLDSMRNVPLGFDTTTELQMVSYMIVLTYKIVNVFGSYPVEFAAAFMPVLFFGLTIISFFLFVREIFVRKKSDDKNLKANIIALISTLFIIIIPVFLSRTVAGIPEKESVGFFFMFLAFYLFLKAWKSEKILTSAILGVVAGISTALMGLSWGGVVYIYTAIGITLLAVFVLNKFHKKEIILSFVWFFVSVITTQLFTNRTNIKDVLTSLDTGLVSLVLFAVLINFLLLRFIYPRFTLFNKIKLPRNIISFIITIILGVILVSFIFGLSFIFEKISVINQMMFRPVTGRWSTTVAENSQPHFQEWAGNFGPFIKNIPVMFWLFFIGSIVLFRRAFSHVKNKDAWILTGLYILLLLGMIFSRYSDSTILTGENFISKLFYYGSILIFVGVLIYYYIRYYKEGNKSFELIDFENIFLLSLFILCLFTARSAVRLIMVLGPIAPILAAYLAVESGSKFLKTKDETGKVVLGVIAFLVIAGCLFSFYVYYEQISSESYNYVPTMYNQQWQKAMQWVRNETPKDAVFAHWWDYGYWVQSIGDRATVLDGGNAITFWNYYMGRLVLTGDNQKDSLDFLYNHNATYLLIDSSDIGKYGAFSSIGSNENYDRFSWIGSYILDEKQTQETKNQTMYVYTGGSMLDEDLIINESGKQVLLPQQKVGVGLIVMPVEKIDNQTNFKQPYVIIGNSAENHKVMLRYLEVNGKFMDFKEGVEACVYIMPSIIVQQQGVGQNPIGAAMFLSPRLMRGYLVQKYILDDPFNKFPNFKIVHTESNLIIESLRAQGMNLPEFVYYQGVQGPIKIWSIKYTGSEKKQQKYLDTDPSKYLNWQL